MSGFSNIFAIFLVVHCFDSLPINVLLIVLEIGSYCKQLLFFRFFQSQDYCKKFESLEEIGWAAFRYLMAKVISHSVFFVCFGQNVFFKSSLACVHRRKIVRLLVKFAIHFTLIFMLLLDKWLPSLSLRSIPVASTLVILVSSSFRMSG